MTWLAPRSAANASARQKGERGFALLLVFLMAAAIAIALYMEVPRAAFEAERAREQRLVDVGEQYQRAVQLYVRKFKKFPTDIDELEKFTNGVRVLRRRYADPMTGKDEWRIVHANPMGDLTDSINTKKDGDKKENAPNTFITERGHVGQEALGTTGNTHGFDPNRRRESEKGMAAPGSNNAPGVVELDTMGNPIKQSQPQQQQPGQTGVPGQTVIPGQGGAQGMLPPGVYPQGQGQQGGGVTGQPMTGAGAGPGGAGQQQGGGNNNMGGISVQPGLGGIGGGIQQQGPGGNPARGANYGSGNFGGNNQNYSPTGPGTATNQNASNQAARDIMNRLTTPLSQQGGIPGVAGVGGALLSGGMAGVASKVEQPGIKVVNERTNVNEWEFVYDFKKDMQSKAQQAGMIPGAGQLGGQQQQKSGSSSSSSGTGSKP